jgi:inward rectifier potassium channel
MMRARPRRRKRRPQPRRIYASAAAARHLPATPRRGPPWFDLYHRLLTIGWGAFFALVAVAYVAFNLFFAALYSLQHGSITAVRPGSTADEFFFSVQTMATIGYGDMHPVTLYANVLVTIEVLLGLICFALVTGLVFARISRPTARVLFSRVAAVSRFAGKPTLMLRVANRRTNRIVEATVTLTLARDEVTEEGVAIRRFYELKPERSRTSLFSLTWTVMHVIDATSPLHGTTPESLAAVAAELIVTIIGLDETVSQTVHARHAYGAADIQWGRRFADILSRDADAIETVDYRRFHDTVAADG